MQNKRHSRWYSLVEKTGSGNMSGSRWWTRRNSTFFFMVIICLCASSLVIPASCGLEQSRRSHHHLKYSYCSPKNKSDSNVALFIFGDSLFDAGNNNYIDKARGRANYWPYGQTFFKYPSGRFCDGRVVPDFIAENMELPLVFPYLYPGNHQYLNGANFAAGGAGALTETYQGSVIPLITQLSYFKNVKKQLRKEVGDSGAGILLSKSIYLFSIGSNDYLAPFVTNSTLLQSYSTQQYVGMVIGNLTTVIKEIYENGGRKFGFMNLVPLGCLPFFKSLTWSNLTRGGCLEEVTDLARYHNKALSEALKELKMQLKGFKYSVFNSYTAVSQRLHNPSKYGFKEAEAACCGRGPWRGASGSCGATKEDYELCDDAGEYLFFDAGHPSENANSQLAELMWKGNPPITTPYNLKTLVQLED